MKPSKDIDEILDYLMQYSFDYGAEKIPTSENPPLIIARQAKHQLLALIEQREREARIDELNNLAQSEVMFFNNDYAQAKLIHDHIEALQKGKL